MIKHLLFDFDGVIGDTFDMNWALTQEHDETATTEDFLAHHDGNVFEEPRITFKPERVADYYSEYHKRLTTSHIEKAIEPLRRLGAQYQLYIVSSNSEEAIRAVLEQAGLLALFTRILGAETHESKAEKFRMLMTDYAVTPENALFISDTLGDIKEARKVGVRTIAVTFGYHDRARLALGEPYRIANTWAELEQDIAASIYFKSKATSLLLLGITALTCSKIVFLLFNDPGGSNLVVVIGLAAILYLSSLTAYLLDTPRSPLQRLGLAILIQILVAAVLYFLGR